MEYLKAILCLLGLMFLVGMIDTGDEKPRFRVLGWMQKVLSWVFIGLAGAGFVLGVLCVILGILTAPLWIYWLVTGQLY